MDIKVTYGAAEGLTKLSAFDKALFNAGIGNYNLIRLSSVIPDGSNVNIEKINWNYREHGYRLYVVLSKCFETIRNNYAYAGLGWITQRTHIGKGFFVEHCNSSEEGVKNKIIKSLKDFQEYRKEEYGNIHYKIVGIKCRDRPVCSVVCAVFKSESW
jgi:arginine decarboxylase